MTNEPEKSDAPLDPRTYFAAERTLLAWVRTGLAMMGFGFVVARFGLFLRELLALREVNTHQSSGLSLWVGTTLVIMGVAVNLAAAFKHRNTVRRLEQGQSLRFSSWSLGMVVAWLLGILGLMMATYLIIGVGH
jgi:putative membrane protein